MGKKTIKTPDWCTVIGEKLSGKSAPLKDVVSAIMLDVETIGEDYAKQKWIEIMEDLS